MLDVITGAGSGRTPYFVHVKGSRAPIARTTTSAGARQPESKKGARPEGIPVERMLLVGYIELPVFPAAFIVPVEFM
jgi:hypothetical protein